MSFENNPLKDERRTQIVARAIRGVPPNVSIPRLVTLILALCDMLDERGVDSIKLLQGMSFHEDGDSKGGGSPTPSKAH